MEKLRNLFKIKKSSKMVVPATLMRSFVMGFKSTITNVFIIDIAASFGLTTSELGGMVFANYISGFVVPFVAGRASDLLGKKRIIILSMIISILGAFMIALAPNVGIYIIGTIIMGVGNTASNSAMTPALADLYPEKAGRYISLSHVLISLATMIGPVLFTMLDVKLGITWRVSLSAIAILTSIPLVMVCLCDMPEKNTEKTARSVKDMLRLLKDPALLMGALALLFYCATDNVYTAFLSVFFDGKFAAKSYGAIALTLHGAMYAIARYLAGYVKKGTKLLGIVTLSISAFSLVMVTVMKEPVWAVIFCALYSLSFAPLYSIIIASTAVAYPGNSGTATSVMFLGGGCGGLVFSTPASLLVGSAGVDSLFYLMTFTCVVALGLFIIYMRKLKVQSA